MKFFSGFSLSGEESLFDEYLIKDDFTVSGFSLGAIEAFLYVLDSKDRIDRLQLLSPAFFQDKNEKFKRLQTLSFQKDQKSYEKHFLENISYPSTINLGRYFKQDSIDSLEKLLNFNWTESDLQKLVNKGVDIEVYLGSEDKIINSKKVHDFFKKFATSYYIKGKGHILNG